MDKKCSKYEGLFVFSDEDTLKKHLQECEECRQEQQQMDRVSELKIKKSVRNSESPAQCFF